MNYLFLAESPRDKLDVNSEILKYCDLYKFHFKNNFIVRVTNSKYIKSNHFLAYTVNLNFL